MQQPTPSCGGCSHAHTPRAHTRTQSPTHTTFPSKARPMYTPTPRPMHKTLRSHTHRTHTPHPTQKTRTRVRSALEGASAAAFNVPQEVGIAEGAAVFLGNAPRLHAFRHRKTVRALPRQQHSSGPRYRNSISDSSSRKPGKTAAAMAGKAAARRAVVWRETTPIRAFAPTTSQTQ
jgi:hypothetical protein